MNLVISNDDGVHAPGIKMLVDAIKPFASSLAVIAPDRNLSGASSSLTLTRPLYAHTHSNGFISIDGTPADCVHLAVTGMLDFIPERVVSGINAGANLGDDVLYSGTVAAALEGRFLAKTAMAVSLVGTKHLTTAAKVIAHLLTHGDDVSNPTNTILNINVPDIPFENICGYQVTRLGFRSVAMPLHNARTPRNQPCYWIAEAGKPLDDGEGTDFHAVANGYVSITPLHIDLTHHAHIASLQSWVQSIG